MTVVADSPPGRTTSFLGAVVDKLILACALVPYALVALGLRIVVARAVFLDGQTKIDGPVVPLDLGGVLGGLVPQAVVLPAQVKDSAFQMFQAYVLPLPPVAGAYLFTYAEFVLPILLVLGFATRFAALLLLAMTVLLTVYVAPDSFWPLHVYWMSILLVLMSLGAGAISVDFGIRRLYGK